MMTEQQTVTITEFQGIDMRIGTITAVELNSKARKPAYVLEIDFGSLGFKKSSAQLTEGYEAEQLIGKQVIGVVNLPPRRVAGIRSEVLVLASVSHETGTILLTSDKQAENGARVS